MSFLVGFGCPYLEYAEWFAYSITMLDRRKINAIIINRKGCTDRRLAPEITVKK